MTQARRAKLLDFGLAKLTGHGEQAAVAMLASVPTRATRAPLTGEGMIVGTLQYMAPEQVEGKPADARTDILALGAMLYEMVTGKRAFEATSAVSLIAAILEREPPPMTSLQPLTPPALDRLVRQCLAKSPDDRPDTAHDVANELRWMRETSGVGALTRVLPRRRRGLQTALVVASALLLFAAGLGVMWLLRRPSPPAVRPLRVSIVHTEGRDVGMPAISPDGTRVAYAARRRDGMPVLWVRNLASGDARALAGTEDARLPFWSPDSRDLGFSAGGALKRIPADGGPIRIITGDGFGGAWAPDGTIVFSPSDLRLFRVSATGGVATPLTKLQGTDWSHYWPSFLPDGRRFLFTAKLWTRTAETSEQGIYLGSLDSPEIRRLLPDLSSAVYAPPGFLVFVRDGTLTAAPFDLATGRVNGQPAPIGGAVAVDDYSYLAAVSAAADGTLAVRPPPAVALRGVAAPVNAELHLVDRGGRDIRVSAAQPFSSYMALNPDGRRLATQIVDPRGGTQDLWLVDLQSGDRTPLTTTRGFTGQPVWSPDGTRLAYAYTPPGRLDDVFIKDLRTGQLTPVIETAALSEHPVAWSHDAGSLLVYRRDEKGEVSLATWSFASRTLTRFAGRPALEAAFSPDDHYVAFTSTESGRAEVAVTTFPERRQTWSLTTDGGRVLSWRADGREILVATLSGHIVAYPVSTEGGFSAGQPAVLVGDAGSAAQFSRATRDHSRILIRVNPDAANDKGEIRLLFGWQDAWRQGHAEAKETTR